MTTRGPQSRARKDSATKKSVSAARASAATVGYEFQRLHPDLESGIVACPSAVHGDHLHRVADGEEFEEERLFGKVRHPWSFPTHKEEEGLIRSASAACIMHGQTRYLARPFMAFDPVPE